MNNDLKMNAFCCVVGETTPLEILCDTLWKTPRIRQKYVWIKIQTEKLKGKNSVQLQPVFSEHLRDSHKSACLRQVLSECR